MPTCKTLLIAALLVATLVYASRVSKSQASAELALPDAKWGHVQVVSYGSGLTGFFDTNSGRLYLYGADLRTPFMTAEIESLGAPLKIVKAPAGQ